MHGTTGPKTCPRARAGLIMDVNPFLIVLYVSLLAISCLAGLLGIQLILWLMSVRISFRACIVWAEGRQSIVPRRVSSNLGRGRGLRER